MICRDAASVHTATLWRKIRVIPVDETFRQWIMQLHLVTKYFWSRIQRRASPTGSASPWYKIIWTFSWNAPPPRLCRFDYAHACLYGCVRMRPIALTKQSSQFSNSGFRDDNFPEFNLLSENLLRINRLPSSLSPRLVSSRRRVFPQFSPTQWNYCRLWRTVVNPSKPNLINQRWSVAALKITRSG